MAESSYLERHAGNAIRQPDNLTRVERVLWYLDHGRPNEPDFRALAATLRSAIRAGHASDVARTQQAAERLLERHGLRL